MPAAAQTVNGQEFWATKPTIDDLPSVLSTPLSEPLFILGTLFVLLVFFVPGGLASLARRLRLVPVAINYDRVLEDRMLTSVASAEPGKKPSSSPSTCIRPSSRPCSPWRAPMTCSPRSRSRITSTSRASSAASCWRR